MFDLVVSTSVSMWYTFFHPLAIMNWFYYTLFYSSLQEEKDAIRSLDLLYRRVEVTINNCPYIAPF